MSLPFSRSVYCLNHPPLTAISTAFLTRPLATLPAVPFSAIPAPEELFFASQSKDAEKERV